MKDLGYHVDVVTLVENIYSQSTIIFIGEHFEKTKPIPIQRGTIQGDTLNPYLAISHIFRINHYCVGYKEGKMDTHLVHPN